MKLNMIKFTSIVWKEGKYYVAQCLNIDVSSFGKTKKQAVNNLAEAVELYLKDTSKKIPTIKSPSIEIRELEYA